MYSEPPASAPSSKAAFCAAICMSAKCPSPTSDPVRSRRMMPRPLCQDATSDAGSGSRNIGLRHARAYRNAPCRSEQGAKQFARQRTIVVDPGDRWQFRQVRCIRSALEASLCPETVRGKPYSFRRPVRCRLGRLARCLQAIARIRARRRVVSPAPAARFSDSRQRRGICRWD